jgi:hypothetical protein
VKPPPAIRVTAEHIAAGVPGSLCLCPVAVAVLGAWDCDGELRLVEVTSDDGGEIWASPGDGTAFVTDWTDEVHGFVRLFDARQPVEPFEFAAEWREVRP